MARTREFDLNKVIHNATIVFCEKGYDGTSITDIVNATKLNRHSMYEIFKNKEGIFIECLYYYSYEYLSKITSELNNNGQDLESIKKFFDGLVEYISGPEYHGCIYCLAISFKTNLPKEIVDVVDRYIAQQKEMFITCLENAKKSSQIPKNKNCSDLAAFLQTSIIGLAMGAKAEMSKKTLSKVNENIIHVLTH